MRLVVLAIAALILLPGQSHAQVLYGAGNGELFTLNTANGTPTLVAATMVGATSVNITGLAFNPTNSLVYCSTGNDSSFGSRICTINLTTGAVTLLPTQNAGPVTDMKFGTGGVLYGIMKVSSPFVSLVSINTTTGAVAPIGPQIGFGFALQGNAFAISGAGVAYWFAGDHKLRTINLTTGAVTLGPSLTGEAGGVYPSAVFASSGTLFASESGQGEGADPRLVTVNPTTGAVTGLGLTSGVWGDGMVFNSTLTPPTTPGTTPPAGAPTAFSTLVLVATGLIGVGAWQLRRARA